MTKQDQNQAPLCILHLEDSALDHVLVKREFQKSGEPVELRRVESLRDFDIAVTDPRINLVLADYHLPGFNAMEAWQLMRDRNIRLPFVVVSGAIGESAAVEAIKAGISDYLPKDDLSKLRHVAQRAIGMHRLLIAKERADAELSQSQQRLASFAQHLQATIEQERASIAREIHDDIGGSLAAIRFDLSWMARHTADEATLSHVKAATDMLQHAVEASQRIMMNLRPAILDQGLAAAIHWLGNSFAKRTGIETLIRTPEQMVCVSKAVQLVAYRTAQEALTNIGKYAQCSQVKIELSGDESVLTLEVADNGVGIAPTALAHPTGFGLSGLKERAKTVGGWLDISSQIGRGTAITLMAPVSEDIARKQENTPHDPSDFV